MTNRNNQRNWPADRSPRVVVPLLFVVATTLVSGCFQHRVVGDGPALELSADWSVQVRPLGNVRPPGNVVDQRRQVPTVDANAGQPLPAWVQAHRATTLWSGPDDKASTLTDLPQWTFLQVVGRALGGRLLVSYAGDYATRQPGIGWVDRAAAGSPARATICSASRRSARSPGPRVLTLATWEHLGQGDVIVQAPFKAYFTVEQSIVDHARFFVRNKRYASALFVADDAHAFAQAIQDAGYATDPSYARKLIGLMDRYDLYRFDS